MNEVVEEVAAALLHAYRTGQPADSRHCGTLLKEPAQAYAVQQAVLTALGHASEPCMYWKSGGPSRTATLTHAPLPAARVSTAPADLTEAPLANPLWIEAEIAVRLAQPVTAEEAASITQEEAVRRLDAMAVSVELVASRWDQGLETPPLLRLADLQSHEGLVLGEFIPFEQRDWARQRCVVEVAGQAPKEFVGTHALGDATWMLPAWLAHATRSGAAVPAGTVLTTGTWCGVVRVREGDRVRVAFDGVGEVALSF